jgi:hypothetical protein
MTDSSLAALALTFTEAMIEGSVAQWMRVGSGGNGEEHPGIACSVLELTADRNRMGDSRKLKLKESLSLRGIRARADRQQASVCQTSCDMCLNFRFMVLGQGYHHWTRYEMQNVDP